MAKTNIVLLEKSWFPEQFILYTYSMLPEHT